MDAPPTAIEAEQAALGACLQGRGIAEAVLAAVREQDFYQDRHAKILAAVRRVVSKGEQPDLITVSRALEDRHELHAIGGSEYLASLIDLYCPVPSNHRAYTRLIKESSIRRRVIAACRRTMLSMQDPEAPIAEATKNLAEDVDSYVGDREDSEAIVPVRIDAALKSWTAAWDNGGPKLVSSGYHKLDEVLGGGFEDGEFILLGARAGVGKTALALEIGVKTARNGRGVLILSREMRLRKLLNRMLAQVGRVPAVSLRNGRLMPADYASFRKAYDDLSPLPLWLDDRAETLQQVEHMVDSWAFTPSLSLVVVDYLQLLRSPKEIKDRRLQVEHISAGLKALAMRRGCPIMAMSSLSRVEKGQQDRRPVISDLRESGELDHDADLVILLHRKFGEEETEAIIAKARDGGVGIVPLRFRPEYVAFEDSDGS